MTRLDHYLANVRSARALAQIPFGHRVLDIGCHDGRLFALGAARQISGVGLDPELPSDRELANAMLYRDMFPSTRVQEKFDSITALAVLEHIPPHGLEAFVQACVDALKPGGTVILTVPSPIVDRILAVLVFLRLVDGMSLEQHHGFDASSTPGLFERQGMTLVRHDRFQLGVNNLFVFRKH
jgi:2-polyprenyl-3-methyl-5-hydroxy-6-metoxy-1,4-benzoquinol methylase